EVRRGEDVGGVFQRGHGLVGARGGVIDRGDVDRDRVQDLVEIHAAVRRTSVVLHLEREGGVACAVRVGGRREYELAGADVGGRDELAGGDRDTVVHERAGDRQ